MVIGGVFLFFGIIGLALPFLQGILFIIIGLVFLSISSSRVRNWLEVKTRPYPKLFSLAKHTEEWLTRVVGSTEDK